MGMMMHRRKKALAKTIAPKEEYKPVTPVEVEPKTVDESSKLTKADIEKLPYFSLKALAITHGLDVENKKANQIRKELIKKIQEEK